MTKHYEKKEVLHIVILHSIFMLMFVPAYLYSKITNESINNLLFFYIPVIAFFIPIITVALQHKFHHKYGKLIITSFILDVLIILSLLLYIIPQSVLNLRNNISIFSNLTPFYFLLISTILLFYTHIEIFKRSFRSISNIRVMFLNPPSK